MTEIQKILAQKAIKGDFFSFVKLMKEDYKVTKFNQYLAWELQQFVYDVEAGKDPFLIVNMEPRAGKSELSSRLLPAWVLGMYPNWEIIVASYGIDLAGDFVSDAKDYIKNENYPFKTEIKFGEDRAYDFETASKGKYTGTGIGGSITGKGGNILIVDDLFKSWKEAQSELQRESAYEFYQATFRTRKTPGKSGILIVTTRWHEDDVTGKIEEKAKSNPNADQPKKLIFPAIAEEDEYLIGPEGKFLFRKKGEVLQPERKGLKEVLKDKATIDASMWESVYQQDPSPAKGFIIDDTWIEDFTWNEIPDDLPVFSYSDTAYGVGKDNSVTVYGFVHNYVGYICHVESLDVSIDNFVDINYAQNTTIKRNQILLGCQSQEVFCDYRTIHLVEPKATGLSVIQIAKRYNVMADQSKELRDSKLVRVKSVVGPIKTGRVKFLKGAVWNSQFRERLKKFGEKAKNQDEADALAGWIRNFLTDTIDSTAMQSQTVINDYQPDAYYGNTDSFTFYG